MPLIYSILCNNRSFSLISRYKTTYKSYLRMVTDQPEAWTNAKPRTSLEVGAPQAFWWSAPCWPEEQADEQPQPCLPLEVSSSGNGGRGIILVPVQWNLTLTLWGSFQGCCLKKTDPSLEVSGRAWQTWTIVVQWVIVTVSAVLTYSSTPCLFSPTHLPFLSCTPLLTNLQTKGYIVCQQTR